MDDHQRAVLIEGRDGLWHVTALSDCGSGVASKRVEPNQPSLHAALRQVAVLFGQPLGERRADPDAAAGDVPARLDHLDHITADLSRALRDVRERLDGLEAAEGMLRARFDLERAQAEYLTPAVLFGLETPPGSPEIDLTAPSAPTPPVRPPSPLLAPGTRVLHRDGSHRTLATRKGDGTGWWLAEGGGLNDNILDAADTDWTVEVNEDP